MGEEVADDLGVELDPIDLGKFADGSIDVQIKKTVRGCDAFVLQTCRGGTIDTDLMELFIICDALRHSFAERIHAIIPHMGYARADSMTEYEQRKPLTAKLVAQFLGAAGATHAMAFNLHSRQIQGFFPWPMDNLYATKLLIEDIKRQKLRDVVLVAPDAGAAKTTEYTAKKIGVDIAHINKVRPRANVCSVTSVVGEVKGRTCIILDDMIDTAGTVCAARDALLKEGANPDVRLYATHPILSDPAAERLSQAGFEEVVVTNTIPIKEKNRFPGLRVISVAPIIASAIRSIHEGACSVTDNL